MSAHPIIEAIELIVQGLQILGVAVISIAFLYATIRAVLHSQQRKPDAYDRLKIFVGKSLQLGLEFLVASDIIGTVTVAPTTQGLVFLALLILLRTFLSWSITVENEGCWPWQVASHGKA
jgi:uncharacterized membrane protein